MREKKCKDKDGEKVKILSAIIVLGPKKLAEIWAVVYTTGNDSAQAGDIFGSFTPTNK